MSTFRVFVLVSIAAVLGTAVVATEPPATGSIKSERSATALFAGGCFWCMEADFEHLSGVQDVESGYAGGTLANPTYEQVGAGGTGHAEAVRVHYDPAKISYPQLLDYFWHHVDPTVQDRQFCDIGNQYRTAIFYQNDAEKDAAEASKAALEKSGRFAHVYTEIAPAHAFYAAEEYHQDYYKKNPIRYKYYRTTCGRDARIAEVWRKQ